MNSAIIDLINTQWVEEEEEEEGENNTNKERQAGKKRENTEKKNLHIQFQKKTNNTNEVLHYVISLF